MNKSAASIQEVNSMNKDQYMEHFRNVLELWPPANDAVMALRPFQDKIAMMDAYKDYIGNLTNDQQLHILQLHPELGNNNFIRGKEVLQHSMNEQKGAKLDQLTEDKHKLLLDMNVKYKEKFGFPFIVCLKELPTGVEVVDLIQERYKNTIDQERETAIAEVKKICGARIRDLVQ